jgi:hypothetical protein
MRLLGSSFTTQMQAISGMSTAQTVDGSKKFLDDLNLPRGLRQALLENTQHMISKRIWIIDNSGSMKIMDGHEVLSSIIDQQKKTPSSSSTRWAEVKEVVSCHAQLSDLLGVPTEFRLLNPPSSGGPQKFRVGYNNASYNGNGPFSFLSGRKADYHRANKIMSRNQPGGKTPLCVAVQEVRSEVVKMLPQLQADGMKVAIVLCTDGCNYDHKRSHSPNEPHLNEELRLALEQLQGLPVCVVIRLCTDYGQVVDFYNDLDEQLGELSFLDVVDDYQTEAAQVHMHNPWLNYALILHRMREMGLQGSNALLDLLDERSFSSEEIRDFCALLFGTQLLPDPLYDEKNFVAEVERLQQREKKHWNPQKGAMTPWIDIEELKLQFSMQ